MKKLKEEILRFISKISSSEMKYNKKLRKKVFNLENHIHEKEATEYIEDPVLQYVSRDLFIRL